MYKYTAIAAVSQHLRLNFPMLTICTSSVCITVITLSII